ncbi:hypothetical protein ES703_14446 [subsurface metagenome]
MKNIASLIIPYDENKSKACAVGATITLYTFQVPSRSKMILTHFSNYLNLNTHWTHVTWRILRNGQQVEPYGAITDQLGLSEQPRKIRNIEFNGADLLTILATDDGEVEQPPVLAVGIAIKFELIG